MTMNLRRFQHLLDTAGTDLARWPHDAARAAERLLASDPAVAAALARARELDALIARDGSRRFADAGAARVAAALAARPLPPQRRLFLWRQWPIELLNVDFVPAWPRMAALASVAVLGFVVGLSDFARPITAPTEPALVSADVDVSTILFEPDPLAELRP